MSSLFAVLVIDKTGSPVEIMLKSQLPIDDYYKKCGFRKKDSFDKRITWKVKNNITVALYAKNEGRSNTVNKYEFPPPVDNSVYYGSCMLIASNAEGPINLTVDSWKLMYADLFGGFEDLDATAEEDEAEVDELADVPPELKTKTGYLKDNFVVEDDLHVVDIADSGDNDSAKLCGSELTEEDYLFSDDE